MITVETAEELRSVMSAARKSKTIALVPTMGALHRGHLSLVELARKKADFVALSIFVNPTQFNNTEDLSKYPRMIEQDAALCNTAGVDLLFAPSVHEIYPAGIDRTVATMVKAAACSQGLCGAHRPGHFDGVVTVVNILFNLFSPGYAVFGEKDYQQLRVIQAMVRDLSLPIEIISAPLVRDEDGLALSSRNQRLTAKDRKKALVISRALFEAQAQCKAGERESVKLIEHVRACLAQSRELTVDYVEIVDTESLTPLSVITSEAQLLVAAFVGGVRLIDNLRLAI